MYGYALTCKWLPCLHGLPVSHESRIALQNWEQMARYEKTDGKSRMNDNSL